MVAEWAQVDTRSWAEYLAWGAGRWTPVSEVAAASGALVPFDNEYEAVSVVREFPGRDEAVDYFERLSYENLTGQTGEELERVLVGVDLFALGDAADYFPPRHRSSQVRGNLGARIEYRLMGKGDERVSVLVRWSTFDLEAFRSALRAAGPGTANTLDSLVRSVGPGKVAVEDPVEMKTLANMEGAERWMAHLSPLDCVKVEGDRVLVGTPFIEIGLREKRGRDLVLFWDEEYEEPRFMFLS